MKQLIVNADDFGITTGVNRAIIEGHQHGIITSTTLMVNMPGFNEAVQLAKANPKLGVGLHFNITQGQPIASKEKIRSLLNSKLEFTGTSTALAQRSILGRLKSAEIEIELRAQIEKALAAGIKPTHLDSHKHAHALPQVFEVLARVLPEYGIGAVRMMLESTRLTGLSLKQLKQSAVGLGVAKLCRTNLDKCTRSQITTTDYFFGIAQTGFWTKQWLQNAIVNLPSGTSELMCHPGYESNEAVLTRLRESRIEELKLLIDPEIKRLVETQNIRLVNFSALSC